MSIFTGPKHPTRSLSACTRICPSPPAALAACSSSSSCRRVATTERAMKSTAPDSSKRSQDPRDSRPAYERAALLWHGKALWCGHCFASQIAAAEAETVGRKVQLPRQKTHKVSIEVNIICHLLPPPKTREEGIVQKKWAAGGVPERVSWLCSRSPLAASPPAEKATTCQH